MVPVFSTEARPVLIEMARLFARLAEAQDTAAPLEMADQAVVQQQQQIQPERDDE
jgi:hypothetical protein